MLNAAISAVQEIRAKKQLDQLQLLGARHRRRAPGRPGHRRRAGGGGARRRRPRAAGRPGGRRRAGARGRDRGRRVAAHRRVGRAAPDAGRGPAVGQPLRRRRGPAAGPGRRRGQLRQPADRRGPPRLHRHHPAAAADRLRHPAHDGARRPDGRRDPAAGRAGGLHPAARRPDVGRAVRAGALRPVLPDRARLHGRGGGQRPSGRARAAGQRRGVGEQRRRRLHRQDGHAHHRSADGGRGAAGRRRGRRGGGGGAGVDGPQHRRAEPDQRGAGRRTSRASRCRCATRCAFSSALRWSARADRRRDVGARRARGAGPVAAGGRPRPAEVRARTARGPAGPRVRPRRRSRPSPCAVPDGRPALPALEPLAVVALADELRPDVPETLARFGEEGIALKVLSGDDPDTVAALAARAGLRDAAPVHAGGCTSCRTPNWTRSSPRGRSSAGSPRSRRNGSSSRCAGRAATWRWSATGSTTPAR